MLARFNLDQADRVIWTFVHLRRFAHSHNAVEQHVGFARCVRDRILFENLENQLDRHAAGGFDSIRPRFESFFRMRGEPVGIEEIAGESIAGIALGIAPNGALEVEISDGPRKGETLRVMAGDVTLAKPASDAR